MTTVLSAAGARADLARALAASSVAPSVFTATMPMTAERAAASSERRIATGRAVGPLDGMLVAVKDCLDVRGVPTTNGSLVAAVPAASRDASVVASLRRAGAVIVGKTNLSELAFSGLGTNPHFGTPANPLSRDEPLVPGGSSAGSAVAVATGIVPLAVGTDTSGSVRVPAAFCGIVGYKSSVRAFSRRGLHALSPTLDSIGFLARTTGTIREAVEALAPDVSAGARRAACSTGAQHRLVVPGGELVEHCVDSVRHAFREHVHRLRADPRFEVVTLSMPVLREAQALIDRHGTIVAAEAYRRHGHLLDGPTARRLDPAVAARLRASAAVSASAAVLYEELPRLRYRLHRQLGSALLVCPTVRVVPPRVADVLASVGHFASHNAMVLRTTMLLSFLGMPGISLPMVSGPAGTGMLVSASNGRDHAVLAAAEDIELALGTVGGVR